MRHPKFKAFVLVALLCIVVVTGCLTARKNPPQTSAALPQVGALSPGPNDGLIAIWTARLMQEYHYLKKPLNTDLSEKFFDGYIETLDPRRENFLQSDIDGFAHWRTNLDTLTGGERDTADLTPAFEIYHRYIERLQQHNDYSDELLKQGNFKFTGSDRILIDRRHAPYPKDLAEAQQFWRNELRYQYLQEKLSRELSATNDYAVLPLPKNADADIAETLARHYRWNFHQQTNWDSTDVLQAYLEALTHAYDPHSDYLNDEHAQDFSINMSLALFGIGAQLTEDDGYCTISKLIVGGPADKSKLLKEKDRIVAVAQDGKPPMDAVDVDLGKIVQQIRGEKGTKVSLTISPAEDRAARRVITLTRDEIKLEDSEAKAKLIEMPDGHGGTNRIGVIDLPSFYAPIPTPGNENVTPKFASADVAKLIKKLAQEKVAGIILDLRNNPGGSLDEAVKFTGLFIKSGPVVLARDPNGRVSVEADNDSSQLYDGPLAVMINRFSASASEIAAAALQDYGRAIVVGDTSTHGKGTVQNLNALYPLVSLRASSLTNDPGTVKITIRKFYRVSGGSTQMKGVVPDIILPDILNYSDDIGEGSLENALAYDTISPVAYDKFNLVAPYIAALHKNSDGRIATNQDFIYINQDIEQFKKLQADKTVSLNERDEIKKRQTNQSRLKARDQERASRKTSDLKTYEITVENADKPGLPEPLGHTNLVDTAAGATDLVTISEGQKPQPEIDPMLNETEDVLEDYISLFYVSRSLIAK